MFRYDIVVPSGGQVKTYHLMQYTSVNGIVKNAHLITGGFPPGSNAGHDMDFVRLRLLDALYRAGFQTSVSSSFKDMENNLSRSSLLISYVAGPFPDENECQFIEDWLKQGKRWFALHGTSGGKAARIDAEGRRRQMVRLAHHDLLGAFFLNHPPIRKFNVHVEKQDHPIFAGIPVDFEVSDELYLIEPMQDGELLMTTELAEDPSPPGFGFFYESDTSLLDDGKTRALATQRTVGKGSVVYVALGHTHAPTNNSQPFVDQSISEDTTTPTTFRGVWADKHFNQLIDNVMAWGAAA